MCVKAWEILEENYHKALIYIIDFFFIFFFNIFIIFNMALKCWAKAFMHWTKNCECIYALIQIVDYSYLNVHVFIILTW